MIQRGPGKPCSVAMTMSRMQAENPVLHDELTGWLATGTRNRSDRQMHEYLQASGYTVGRQTLGRHRRGECRCANGQPIRPELDTTILRASNVLVFDIETKPARVEMDTYDLKLRNPYIHHRNVVEPGGMIAWAAHWLHEPGVVHYADMHDDRMHERLWELLDKASYVVSYNGDNFDLRRARGYFARLGYPPFRKPKSIDLIKAVRTFGIESNSLEYACRMFDTPHKKLAEETGGAGNWRGVVDGDPLARKLMRRYCTHDVRATADLYLSLLPWIPNHPHMGFAADDDALRCPRCGSDDHSDAGVVQAVVVRYRGRRCNNCTGHFRTTFHSRVGSSRAA